MKKYIVLLLTVAILLGLTTCSSAPPREKFLSFLYPSFYMKVVDQDGTPVEGVTANVSHRGKAYIGKKSTWAKYVSDQDGLFKIKMDSRPLAFDAINKPGYSIRYPQILHQFYQTRPYSVPVQADIWPADLDQIKWNAPLVIPVWRIDAGEQQSRCHNGSASYLLNSDGRNYGIDLLAGRGDELREATPERTIQMNFLRPELANPNSTASPSRRIRRAILNSEWAYSISAPHGGIQEVDDLYKNRAPTTGYEKSFRLTNESFRARNNYAGSAGDEDDRHFYVRLDDDHYARLGIRFDPIGSSRADFENGKIRLDYSVNLDGSRYVNYRHEDIRFLSRDQKNEQSCFDQKLMSAQKSKRIYLE